VVKDLMNEYLFVAFLEHCEMRATARVTVARLVMVRCLNRRSPR
jgi:hypothetical protein